MKLSKNAHLLSLLFPIIVAFLFVGNNTFGDTSFESLLKPLAGQSMRNSSSAEDIEKNGDARPIEPNQTLILMDEDGPGMITHFWNTIATENPFYPRSIVLRIYYDGLEKPSVEAPIGDFFGLGLAGHKEFISQPVVNTSRGRARVCFWPMPFQKHIKVTVTNESDIRVGSFYYYLDWKKLNEWTPDTPYFHARYRQEYPAQSGNYTLLETQGKGHYVGTVYSALQMETGWFGEGDDFFYIDGAETPQLKGTGTEDYFNDAWGFREFYAPYYGVPMYEGVFAGDRVSIYRWHIPDPVHFEKSLKVVIEHKGSIMNEKAPITKMDLAGFKERKDWVSSVAFWYQTTPTTWDEPIPTADKRIPPYKTLKFDTLVYRADPAILTVPTEYFLLYIPLTPKSSIEFDFEITQKGTYRIDSYMIFSIFSGVFQPYMDGKPFGAPIDFSAPGYDIAPVYLDIHELSEGIHTLRFEGIEQTPKHTRTMVPKTYGLGIANLLLLRLEDMEGYRSVLKELDPNAFPQEQKTGQ
ncbi:MAG TPA: DUF2961 domain-containing protein [Candidatus Hydrogenedens sp.]|nr:DUF2961 domain-containing protein [Candidatus Hydrogenedens sp.]HPP60020.1 DUF2961 domain-containing protein [Candidatus Hydrogenedens sp.]